MTMDREGEPDSSDNKDLEEITGEDNEKRDDEIEERAKKI